MTSNSVLLSLYEMWSTPISLKEPESGKYIFTNTPCLELLGLTSSDQILGLTVDTLSFSQSQTGRTWAEHVRKLDDLVQREKSPINDMQLFLNANDRLVYTNASKCFLHEGDGRVLGLATFGHNLVPEISAHALYLLYRKLCGASFAIEKFLRHFQIDAWFFTLPTEAELWVLLAQAAGETTTTIAQYYEVPTKTIETHINAIRRKINTDSLQKVSTLLAARSVEDNISLPLSEHDRWVNLRSV